MSWPRSPFAGLAHWLGAGWALLITLLAGVAGYAPSPRGNRVIRDLGKAARNEIRPTQPPPGHGAVGLLDGACDPSGYRDHGARCAAHGAAGAQLLVRS